ncbi:hypothetical protein RB195_024454 [Necator americanus]|uniref:PID domain-containing protein n=1 Tax=Necator americanus TaxID=51031 RepID=A0ABR1EN91_NECAM
MDGHGLVITSSPRYACSGLPTVSSAGTYPAAEAHHFVLRSNNGLFLQTKALLAGATNKSEKENKDFLTLSCDFPIQCRASKIRRNTVLMPVLNSSTSPSQFFTFPFRRKKQCYTINPPDLCYDVIYLGNVLTIMAGGEHCFEKPLALIWKAYCSRADADLSMGLEITRSGLKAKTKEQGLTEYWANRITSSGALPHYPKIFCWIYRHDGKRLKPDLRCHAVLCKRSSDAVTIHNKLQEFLHAALQVNIRRKKC